MADTATIVLVVVTVIAIGLVMYYGKRGEKFEEIETKKGPRIVLPEDDAPIFDTCMWWGGKWDYKTKRCSLKKEPNFLKAGQLLERREGFSNGLPTKCWVEGKTLTGPECYKRSMMTVLPPNDPYELPGFGQRPEGFRRAEGMAGVVYGEGFSQNEFDKCRYEGGKYFNCLNKASNIFDSAQRDNVFYDDCVAGMNSPQVCEIWRNIPPNRRAGV